MGGLGHYLEREGLATTQISLIRLHTEKIKPPRALWVPFDLGRPLGAPNDPVFQTRVLMAALKLLEAPSGPVLEDFPDEAPTSEDYSGPVACPLPINASGEQLEGVERLRAEFLSEAAQMGVWYEIARDKRQRTSVGASGLDPRTISEFLAACLQGGPFSNPRPEIPLASLIKLAVEDLKTYYFEAAAAQPGRSNPNIKQLNDWFWGRTAAGSVFIELQRVFRQSADPDLRFLAERLLVPMSQAGRLSTGKGQK